MSSQEADTLTVKCAINQIYTFVQAGEELNSGKEVHRQLVSPTMVTSTLAYLYLDSYANGQRLWTLTWPLLHFNSLKEM